MSRFHRRSRILLHSIRATIGNCWLPLTIDLVSLISTRPRRQRNDYNHERLVAVGTELESGAERNGDAHPRFDGHYLLSIPLFPPHLSTPTLEIPDFLNGSMRHRIRYLAWAELEMREAASGYLQQRPDVRSIWRDVAWANWQPSRTEKPR